MMIYVCSPARGDPPYMREKLECNLQKAAEYCRSVVQAGHIPIAPHLYFRPFLNDENPKERAAGMEMGTELLKTCAEVWVFGKIISEGMNQEIQIAQELGIPIIYK